MKRGRSWSAPLLAAVAATSCVATTPSTPRSEEHLVVLNAGDATLSIFPLSEANEPRLILLGNIGGSPMALAARNTRGLVTSGAGSSVAGP